MYQGLWGGAGALSAFAVSWRCPVLRGMTQLESQLTDCHGSSQLERQGHLTEHPLVVSTLLFCQTPSVNHLLLCCRYPEQSGLLLSSRGFLSLGMKLFPQRGEGRGLPAVLSGFAVCAPLCSGEKQPAAPQKCVSFPRASACCRAGLLCVWRRDLEI